MLSISDASRFSPRRRDLVDQILASSETFDYAAVVPDGPQEGSATWRAGVAEHAGRTDEAAMRFGREPTLTISDADPPPNSNPGRPWVLRSRLTLNGSGRVGWFHVDRSLTAELLGNDTIHMARTERGGLGLSILRNRQLVFAVGAVTAVPLGEDVRARIAPELQNDAIARLEPPDGARDWNPTAQYRHEWPVEITIGGATHLFFCGNVGIHGIQLFMAHGFRARAADISSVGFPKMTSVRGVLGTDECIALSRFGRCSNVGANASALLLDADGLEQG